MQCNTFDMKNDVYQPDTKALQLFHVAVQENTNTIADFTFWMQLRVNSTASETGDYERNDTQNVIVWH